MEAPHQTGVTTYSAVERRPTHEHWHVPVGVCDHILKRPSTVRPVHVVQSYRILAWSGRVRWLSGPASRSQHLPGLFQHYGNSKPALRPFTQPGHVVHPPSPRIVGARVATDLALPFQCSWSYVTSSFFVRLRGSSGVFFPWLNAGQR